MLQRWGFKREGLSFFQVDTAGLNGLAVSTLPFVSIPFQKSSCQISKQNSLLWAAASSLLLQAPVGAYGRDTLPLVLA